MATQMCQYVCLRSLSAPSPPSLFNFVVIFDVDGRSQNHFLFSIATPNEKKASEMAIKRLELPTNRIPKKKQIK